MLASSLLRSRADTIAHTLTAALQDFFACEQTTNGVVEYALKWGVFNSNGSAPFGCTPTDLYAVEC
jgi:hypothetical protein